MARMGHDSERAALIYLHSSAERQRTLADEVGRMAAAELAKSKTAKPSGTLTHGSQIGPMDRLMANRMTCGNDLRPDRDSNAGPTA
jgi:hypothetical protein